MTSGLGKTIDAGLVLQELILRQQAGDRRGAAAYRKKHMQSEGARADQRERMRRHRALAGAVMDQG